MKKIKLTLCLLLGAFISTASHADILKADDSRIKAHLRFLSHDLLEGRDTGSQGLEIASLYIASQFEQYGLLPAGDNGSYMQRVTFRQSFLDQDSPEFVLNKGGETTELKYPKEFLVSPSAMYEDAHVSGELVFVGYGIIAPELEHNDYAGLDVEGKIVVMLSGKPQSFPSEEGAHFASGYQKGRYAAENGAIGTISIPTPRSEKARPYERSLNYIHVPRVRWLKEDGMPANTFAELKNGASLSPETAKMLFAGEKMSLEDIYAELEDDKSPKGFAMQSSIELSKKSEFKEITSPNVVAILPGSDPELAKEYVSFSAHHDHIGIAKTVEKDKINNGALDNASGTSVLLETARLLAQAPAPKRSILFVAVTGEEKGLLGSDYYAQNPTVPIESIVANVNLDMPVLTYEFADVIAFGAEHSSLKASVTAAAKYHDLTLGPDPMPDQAIFTRSDHYSFVKQGVPSVFVIPGWTAVDPEVDGAKKFGEFFGKCYHKPCDEFSEDFNWKAAVKFAEVNIQIGQTIANQMEKPTWNDDSFFGNTFGR
ncbi:M28 family metallopeptidase [Planctobacterium marinum]|uniref:Aminopeptidase n=1 Tax=Planctobacterium marinum TaxID=1631968 RepID=A0AA48HTX8_9ALTE|nr:aminopeptidase [Planctobacterium marinum]